MASSPRQTTTTLTALALALALLSAAGPCSGSSGVSVSSGVTDAFFNGIKNHAQNGCEGKNFYTRSAFLSAADSFPGFAHGGSEADGKREIAAFFAHVTYQTGYFCYISDINRANVFCDPMDQWPCVPGKKYYGRGPLQISWNFNYGPAGKSIGVDLLANPDAVAKDPVISFKTAFWIWMNNAHQVMPQGFGATIKALNGLVCNGKSPDQMKALVGYYKQYCQQLDVDPGNNITC
ncbi:unnamed protein product [Urochloa humidicola]